MNSKNPQRKLIAATRGSQLALTQSKQSADYLVSKLADHGINIEVELRTFKTTGDRVTDTPLTGFSTTGVFVKELETALLNNEADFAVHSLKDVPTDQPDELKLSAWLPRENPGDLLIQKNKQPYSTLPPGAIIGTGSPRRILQLKLAYGIEKGLQFNDLRGNLDTRLRKLQEENYDAIIVAAAGMNRLSKPFSESDILPLDFMIPAPGQGAIVFESREQDKELNEWFALVTDAETRLATLCERVFMRALEGGCTIPLAAHAQIINQTLVLNAITGDHETAEHERANVEIPLKKNYEEDAILEGIYDAAIDLRERSRERGIRFFL